MAYGQGEYGQIGYGGSSLESGGPALTFFDPSEAEAITQDDPLEFVVESPAELDVFSLKLSLGGKQAIVGGVFLSGYEGSITYDPETKVVITIEKHPDFLSNTEVSITITDLAGNTDTLGYNLLVPNPIVGHATVTASPTIETSVPVRAIVSDPKTFSYMQRFQRGDLPIHFSTAQGSYVPATVSYTLYQVREDGTRKRVGPRNRVPVAGTFGEFYVTGRAGESGQPGRWVVKWEYQRNYSYPVEEKEMAFQVVDAATLNCPLDTTPRCNRYGWN